MVSVTAVTQLPVTSSVASLPDTGPFVSVYPNPLVTGPWNLAVSNDLIGALEEISDAGGKTVYYAQIKSLRSEIPSQLPGGVYLLRITSGNTIIVRKLVKL